jgi:hypothetical protein
MTQAASEALPQPIPALELIVRGYDKTVAFACGKCGSLFVPKELGEEDREQLRETATNHCFKRCKCGQPLDRQYWGICSACSAKEAVDKEQNRFDKAKKLNVDQYPYQPVYWEGHIGGMGEGYFSGVEELIDYCEEEGLKMPEYVWACSSSEFKLDADTILESELASQEVYEDAYDNISDEDKSALDTFLKDWAKKQNIVSWQVDYAQAVLLASEAPTEQ